MSRALDQSETRIRQKNTGWTLNLNSIISNSPLLPSWFSDNTVLKDIRHLGYNHYVWFNKNSFFSPLYSVKILWRSNRLPTPVFLGFPGGSDSERICLQCGKPGFYSLVWENPLEGDMATHSSILAWRIPMDRGAWWLLSIGSQKVTRNWVTMHNTTHTVKIQGADSLEKTLMLGKIEGRRRRGATEYNMVGWHH